MKTLVVQPHKGIGKILFGMSRKEVEEIICEKLTSEYRYGNDDVKCVEVRYDEYCIDYKDDVVVDIYITNFEKSNVVLNGIDLFYTKAEDILDSLKLISDYDCDCEDENLGTAYYFKDLGLELWRERAYHPKLLNDDGFQRYISENEENLEYEQKFWYFQQIRLSKQIIYNKPMKKMKPNDWSINEIIEIKEPTQKELDDIAKKYGLKK